MRRISCTCLVLLVCLSVGSFADNVHPNEDSKVEDMARIENTKPVEEDKEQQHQDQQEKENHSMNSEEKEDDVLSESNAGEGETGLKEDIPSNLKTRSFDMSASMSSMENDGLMDRGMFGFGRGKRRRGMGMGMGGLGMGMGGMYPGLGRSPYGGMGSRYGMGRMMGGGRYGMGRMMGGYGGMSPYGDPSMMGGMGMNGMGGMGMNGMGGMGGMGMMPGMM